MKNILVTGGTGFIGSNICKYLIKEKYNTIVFDNNSRGNIKRLKSIRRRRFYIKFQKKIINIIISLLPKAIVFAG